MSDGKVLMDLDLILPDPDNIRDFNDDDIAQLAESIEMEGQLQPITVYPLKEGYHRVWMGHRRHAALKLLNLTHENPIQAWVSITDKPESELQRIDRMATENIQRKNLNPIEEARLYQRYTSPPHSLNQSEIARRLNVLQTRVSNFLKLLDYSLSEQAKIITGEWTVTEALNKMKEIRRITGHAKANTGTHKVNSSVPHFTVEHELYWVARRECEASPHSTRAKLGAACGPCWEMVIVRHANGTLTDLKKPAVLNGAPADDGPVAEARPSGQAYEFFNDPREILRRLTCVVCETPALAREDTPCYKVIDGTRKRYPKHTYRMAVVST